MKIKITKSNCNMLIGSVIPFYALRCNNPDVMIHQNRSVIQYLINMGKRLW